MLDTGLRFDPAGSAIQTGYEDRMERLYKKLEAYGQEGFYPFHMPGHKRNKASVYGDFPIEQDITEIYGFDNLHHAEGIIKEAQGRAGQTLRSKTKFFFCKWKYVRLFLRLFLLLWKREDRSW